MIDALSPYAPGGRTDARPPARHAPARARLGRAHHAGRDRPCHGHRLARRPLAPGPDRADPRRQDRVRRARRDRPAAARGDGRRRHRQVPHPRALGHARPPDPGVGLEAEPRERRDGRPGDVGQPHGLRPSHPPFGVASRDRRGEAGRAAAGRRQQHPRRPESDLAGLARPQGRRLGPRRGPGGQGSRGRLREGLLAAAPRGLPSHRRRGQGAGPPVRRTRPLARLGPRGVGPRHEEHGAPLRPPRRVLVAARPNSWRSGGRSSTRPRGT